MDERIPALTYLGVDDPSQISDGDYDRLTFFDAAGTDDFPYDPEFLRRTRGGHAYDRFAHYGTRFLFSGYGFSMVGRAGDYMYGTVLERHFGQHYFKLGLLAHFLRASLLGFAEELSEAIKRLRGEGDAKKELANPRFRDAVQEIQNRFLKFRSRAWFPEVSNQLQGGELHRLWFAQLNIDALFAQVDETSDQLHAILSEYETRQLSRSQEKLSKIAGVFLPLSIGLSLLSVLFAQDLLPRAVKAYPALDTSDFFFAVGGVFTLLGGVGGWLLARWKWK
jgi:hypothetical protein